MRIGPALRVSGLVLVLVLAALAWCAVPAAWAEQAPGGFVIIEEPDELAPGGASSTSGARLSGSDVERIARKDAGVTRALTLRPEASLRLAFDARTFRWTASLRDKTSKARLAYVVIDDRNGAIKDRFELPLGQYPSHLTRRLAIDAVVADADVRGAAKRWGGVEVLRATARLDGCCWEVDLYTPAVKPGGVERLVMRADVRDNTGTVTGVWTGIQIAWKMARGDRRAFGNDVNDRQIWLSFFVLFALVAIDWRRVRSLWTLDVLAILAIGIGHEFFLRGEIGASVPLAVPPLAWLGARMAWVFARGLPRQRALQQPTSRIARVVLRRVPTIAIVVLCVALAGLRIGITVDGGNVIDVGYAGVAGARDELKGVAPWGNMPSNNPHGDTYGPLNYLAYLPATVALDDPDRHQWGGDLPAALWTTIISDLACVLLLAAVGWRWISRRGAALLAAGWLACPWTLWALASGVNDALVALLLLVAFAALPRSLARGGLVGLAAMVKFAPLVVLAPMLHVGARRRTRQSVLTMTGAAVAVVAGLAWVSYRIEGGLLHDLQLFAARTIKFQLGRDSPFSIWGYHHWRTAQVGYQIVVVGGVLVMCLLPRARDAWQVSAGMAAALIAVQLGLTHWFYLYIPWFIGFVLLVLVAARERPAVAADGELAPDMLGA